MIKKRYYLFLFNKAKYLLIIKNILKKIFSKIPKICKKFNTNTIFKIAWTGFFCLKKIIYIDVELKKLVFKLIYIIKLDILFAKYN